MSEISIEDFIKKDRKADFKEIFEKYKSELITVIYYSLGLFLGAYYYKTSNNELIINLITIENKSIGVLFFFNLSVYFSVFLIVLFLGFCLFGKHIINIIPAIIGVTAGIRIAYYFVNYGVKGIGFALIIIMPYTALFITVLSLAVEVSSSLSHKLLESAKNENKIFVAKPFMKKYFYIGIGIICTAFINATLTSLMMNVITI